jgi:type I restriction enzyme, S subunit
MQEIQNAEGDKQIKNKTPSDWMEPTLEEISFEIYRYPTYYNIEYLDNGVPEVRGELINENATLENDIKKYRFISQETSNRFIRTILNEGDLVLSVRGTIEKIAIVHNGIEGANITANLMRISPKRNAVYPLFLKYSLLSEHFQNRLQFTATDYY